MQWVLTQLNSRHCNGQGSLQRKTEVHCIVPKPVINSFPFHQREGAMTPFVSGQSSFVPALSETVLRCTVRFCMLLFLCYAAGHKTHPLQLSHWTKSNRDVNSTRSVKMRSEEMKAWMLLEVQPRFYLRGWGNLWCFPTKLEHVSREGTYTSISCNFLWNWCFFLWQQKPCYFSLWRVT